MDINKFLPDLPEAALPHASAPSTDGANRGAQHAGCEVLRAVAPATGEWLASVFATAPARVPAIVARARAAAHTWGGVSYRERAHALVRLRDLVAERARDIAETTARGTGKPLIEALLREVAPVIDTLDECVAYAADDLADEPVAALVTLPSLLGRYRAGLLPCSPRAVVCVWAGISSPFELAMTPAIISLTAGNAVIVKPASSPALVGVLIERLLDDAFSEFPGLAQVVHGARSAGSALTTSEGVDAVLFTGSTPTRAANRAPSAVKRPDLGGSVGVRGRF